MLLGYKDVGFGKNIKPYDTSGLAVALKLIVDNTRWHQLSVDTAVLEQYKDLCEVLEISKVLTTSPEGKFSMYIDVIECKMAPSSYVDDSKYVPLMTKNKFGVHHLRKNYILEEFAKW